MISIPVPRALPLTILALAALLAMKILTLTGMVPADGPDAAPLLGAGVTMVAAANAASPPAAEPATPAPANAGAKAMPDTETAGKSPTPTPATAAPAAAPAPVPVRAPPDPQPISDSERAVLLDLRKRRQELDARESGDAAREAMLGAAESRLTARIAELTALQTRLEALDRARREREESNWQGLVKIYQDMRPRDAATIFNGLDMSVLLEVLDRMKERSSAPILAAMQPDKARQATADLAEKRLKTNSIGG